MEIRMKQARKSKKLTLKEVAELVGVTESAVSKYECSKAAPSDAVIKLFCEKLHISESWLRTGEGEMEEETPAGLIEQLAKEHNLSMGHVALLRAVSRAFSELDEETFNRIMDDLHQEINSIIASREAVDPSTVPVVHPQSPADSSSSVS